METDRHCEVETREKLRLLLRPENGAGKNLDGALEALLAMEHALLLITEAAGPFSSTRKELCQAIVDAIPEATHYDAATISFYEPSLGAFRVEAQANHPLGWVREVAGNDMLIKSKELADAMSQSEEPIVFDDFDNHPVSRLPRKRPNAGGMAFVPLRLSKHNWAVLGLASREEVVWSQAELGWVKILGKHCELVIRQAQTLRQERRRVVQQGEQFKERLRADLERVINESDLGSEPRRRSRAELSRREQKTLALLAKGNTNQEIAQEMGISLGTAKKYVHALLVKLDVKNRAQAAAIWLQLASEEELLDL